MGVPGPGMGLIWSWGLGRAGEGAGFGFGGGALSPCFALAWPGLWEHFKADDPK